MNASQEALLLKLLKKDIHEDEILRRLEKKGLTDERDIYTARQQIREYHQAQRYLPTRLSPQQRIMRFLYGLIILALGAAALAWVFGFIGDPNMAKPRIALYGGAILAIGGIIFILRAFGGSDD